MTEASQSRARWLLVLLALTAALFLVVGSACGGDDDDDDSGGNSPTATDSADGGDDGGDETPTDSDSDGNGGDAADQLAAFAGEYEQFNGYVKYGASNFSSDDSLSSMALYQKGDKSRIDIESADGSVTLIETPDASYVCSEGQCIQYPAGDTGGVGDIFTAFLDPAAIQSGFLDVADDVDFDVSKKKIAGIDATCFSASGDLDPDTPGDEQGEVCFAEGGLLLRLTFVGGGESGTFEAVEADSDVPDDAFDPPFDVIDLSDLGQ